MTEQNDKMDARVEGMLRRWGAAEAMEQAHAPAAPSVASREVRPAGPPAGRYFLIGAAAGLLAAVCGGFLLKQFSLQFEHSPFSSTQVAGHEDSTTIEVPVAYLPDANPSADAGRHLESAALQKEIQRLEKAIAAGPADKVELEKQLAAAREKYQLALAGKHEPATQDSAAELMARAEEYRNKLATLEQTRDSREKQFLDISKALKDAQDDNARLLAMLKDANAVQLKYDVAEKRLAAAVGELARVRKMSDESQQAREKAQTEIAAASAHREALLLDIQRSLVGEEITLKSRQDAAKRYKLVDRCGDLRKTDATDASRKLMDKLEVVLLRLSMMDASDTAAAASFGNLLRENDLVRQIDQTLAAGGEGAKMRVWLVEVRCVLMGADRVA